MTSHTYPVLVAGLYLHTLADPLEAGRRLAVERRLELAQTPLVREAASWLDDEGRLRLSAVLASRTCSPTGSEKLMVCDDNTGQVHVLCWCHVTAAKLIILLLCYQYLPQE